MDSGDAKEIGEAREMAQDRYDDLIAQRDQLRDVLEAIVVRWHEDACHHGDWEACNRIGCSQARAVLEASKP